MAANTQPIFSSIGAISASGIVTAANTAMDGTGTLNIIMTANAGGNAAGNFVQKVICQPYGTNVATVARFFRKNAAGTNISMVGQATLPATTLTQTAAMTGVEFPINYALPPGEVLFVLLGTAVAAGWNFTAIAGQY